MNKTTNKYAIAAISLFLIEVIIAVFIHDTFIRPYFGDFLVVILLYCLIKSVFNYKKVYVAIGVLLFSYLVEILQYFDIVKLIGLGDSKLANIIIGNYFSFTDLLCYSLGVVAVLCIDSQKLFFIHKFSYK